MRTRLEYRGESLPVMGCNFTASIHPPAPKFAGPEYDAWKKKLDESPEMRLTLEIAFPRFYWRAQYRQQGNKPLYIVDFPVIGNAVQLKDCVFLDNCDLKLPNGLVIRGFPYDDMTAEAIRKNTAILEQEGLAINGNAELLAKIERMDLEIKRIHAEHFGALMETLTEVREQGADIAAEARRLKEGKRQAEEKSMDTAREVIEMLLRGLTLQQRNLFFAMKSADGNQTHAAEELGISQGTVNKALPALRDAIRATGKELPEFLLPPAERKRLPDKPGQEAWGPGGREAAETRTPFDEVAEKDEGDGGAE